MTENEVLQALPAYALNALEPDEMVAVRAFLQSRPDLMQRMESLADAASQMAYAAPSATLPPQLRSRILEVARADAALTQQAEADYSSGQGEASIDAESSTEIRGAAEGAVDAGPAKAAAPFQRPAHRGGAIGAARGQTIGAPTPIAPPRPAAQPASNRPAQPRRNWFAHALGWKVATLASLAAAVVLAVINAQMLQDANNFATQMATLQQNADTFQAQVTTLQTDKSELEQALARAEEDAAAQRAEMAQQLTALNTQVAALQKDNQQLLTDYNEVLFQQTSAADQLTEIVQTETFVPIFGTEDTPGALGALFAGPAANLLALRGLDILPAEQTYELWLIDAEGTPIPAGLLGADAPTHTAIRVDLPEGIEDYAAVAVSIEPAAGSEQPTGPIVMVGTRT